MDVRGLIGGSGDRGDEIVDELRVWRLHVERQVHVVQPQGFHHRPLLLDLSAFFAREANVDHRLEPHLLDFLDGLGRCRTAARDGRLNLREG
jgi:hypothetical protein